MIQKRSVIESKASLGFKFNGGLKLSDVTVAGKRVNKNAMFPQLIRMENTLSLGDSDGEYLLEFDSYELMTEWKNSIVSKFVTLKKFKHDFPELKPTMVVPGMKKIINKNRILEFCTHVR